VGSAERPSPARVTRVARKWALKALGGQVRSPAWPARVEDLTIKVNAIASPHGSALRNIAEGQTASPMEAREEDRWRVSERSAAQGDNQYDGDQLNAFASEVTRWARGGRGRLGGQANVRGVARSWKDLAENANSWLEPPARCATSPGHHGCRGCDVG